MTGLLDELLARIKAADPEEFGLLREEVLQRTSDMAWIPNPGPQTTVSTIAHSPSHKVAGNC
ncbi:MAG: hypothetical protein ACR2PG_08665 [Hyphomicrobiaceae bacterium]